MEGAEGGAVDEVEAEAAALLALVEAAAALAAALVADVVAEAASTTSDHLAESTLVVIGCDPDDVCAVTAINILLVDVSLTTSCNT